MGGWDAYCAFCGALATAPVLFDEEEGEEPSYDRTSVTEETTVWMDDVRIMVFISTKAHHDDGFFEFDEDEDEHPAFFPTGHDDRVAMEAYAHDESGSPGLAVPFHEACYDLLRKQVGVNSLNLDLLYQVLKHFRPENYERCLNIDYGAISEYQEQYWDMSRGTEIFVADPKSIPWLTDYYGNLPAHLLARSVPPKAVSQPGQDVFALLPPEIILHIMSYLDIASALRLRQASRTTRNLDLDRAFWRGRIKKDLAFLYDFPSPESVEHERGSIDYRQVYKDVLSASDLTSDFKIHGLANRRRIWEIMQQITDPYLEAVAKHSRPDMPSLIDAKATAMYPLILPEPQTTETSTIPFVESKNQLPATSTAISVYWSDRGELTGMSTRIRAGDDDGKEYIVGEAANFVKTDECVIPAGEWLLSVIIRSQENAAPEPDTNEPHRKRGFSRTVVGLSFIFAHQDPIHFGKLGEDLRVIAVEQGTFAVGVMGQWSVSDGQIAKLALLHQPLPYGLWNGQVATRYKETCNTTILPYLWKTQLPPPILQLTRHLSGYWAHRMKMELSPMEYITFGKDESSMSDMISIGGDVAMGGFEVHYANGPPTSIGPRHNQMQYLQIDGAGGERVIAIHICAEHIIRSVRFVTNRSRQLVIGVPGERETRFTGAELGESASVTGIYCNWSDYSDPASTLDVIGVALTDTELQYSADVDFNGPSDSQGFSWVPSHPPPSIEPRNRLWGQHQRDSQFHQVTDVVPAPGTLVSWLDCRRNVKAIKAVLCHGQKRTKQLPLVGLTLEYADDVSPRESSIGPTLLQPPMDREGMNGHHWCWCAYGSSNDDERRTTPHTRQEIFEIGDARLEEVRIWLNEEGGLSGMQMVAANGRGGPRWGCATDGEPAGRIGLGDGELEGGGHAAGLKFFVYYNERHVTYDDLIVVGVQMLVEQ